MKMTLLLLLACSAALISNMDAVGHRRPVNAASNWRKGMAASRVAGRWRKGVVANRDTILKHIGDYNATLPEEVRHSFVEDIENLTRVPHKCKPEFFCRVEAILANNTHVKQVMPMVKVMTALNADIKDTCDKVKARKATDDENEIEFQKLLKLLQGCLEYVNYHE